MTNDFDHEYEYVRSKSVGEVFHHYLYWHNWLIVVAVIVDILPHFSLLYDQWSKQKFWAGIRPQTSVETRDIDMYSNEILDFWRKSKWGKRTFHFAAFFQPHKIGFERIFDGVVYRFQWIFDDGNLWKNCKCDVWAKNTWITWICMFTMRQWKFK